MTSASVLCGAGWSRRGCWGGWARRRFGPRGWSLRTFTRLIWRRMGALAAENLWHVTVPFQRSRRRACVVEAVGSRRGRPDRGVRALGGRAGRAELLGAALSMLWLILPHPGRAQELPIAGATLALCAVATVLIAGRQPKPSWLPHTAIAVDTFVVSVCLVATRDASSVYAFSYLWGGAVRGLLLRAARGRDPRGVAGHRLRRFARAARRGARRAAHAVAGADGDAAGHRDVAASTDESPPP